MATLSKDCYKESNWNKDNLKIELGKKYSYVDLETLGAKLRLKLKFTTDNSKFEKIGLDSLCLFDYENNVVANFLLTEQTQYLFIYTCVYKK